MYTINNNSEQNDSNINFDILDSNMNTENEEQNYYDKLNAENLNWNMLDSDIDNMNIENEERNYYDKLNAKNLNWKSIHNEIDLAIIKQGLFPADELCLICNKAANIRCHDCGPHIFFCNFCNEKNHYKINLFHCQSDRKSPHKIIKKKIYLQPLCQENCNHEIGNITLILLKGK